jgi:hypothetical protein
VVKPFAEYPTTGETDDSYQMTGRLGYDGEFKIITAGDLRAARRYQQKREAK